MKKILSLVLVLVMLFSLAPMSFAVEPTSYNLWVNGEQFTSDKLTIDCDKDTDNKGSAVYSNDTKILTLTNATILKGSTDDSKNLYGIRSDIEGLTIKVVGTNSISVTGTSTGGDDDNPNVYGIGGSQPVTVEFEADTAALSISANTEKSDATKSAFQTEPTRIGCKFTTGTTFDASSAGLEYVATYTVTFDPNEGTVTPTTKIVNAGETYGTLPTPTRTGYNFDGWYTEKTEGSKVSQDQSPDDKKTLYAHWLPLNITYFDKGGEPYSGTNSADLKNNHTYGDETQLVSGVREGFTFDGWHKDAACTDTTVSSIGASEITSDIKLYANWYQNYVLTFKATSSVGGNAEVVRNSTTHISITETATDIKDAIETDSIVITAEPSENYKAKIFTTDKVLAESTSVQSPAQYTVSNEILKASSTIYVSYYLDTQVTVKFDVNGGTDIPTGKDQIVRNVGDVYGTLPETTLKGYSFIGWFTEKTGGNQVTATTAVTNTENHTLYAHWAPITYMVHFDKNEATSGTMNDQQMTYDTETALTTNAFVRTGYKFLGWATDSKATAATYTDGAKVKNLKDTNETVTLYAIWGKYTVNALVTSSTGGSATYKITGSTTASGTLTTTSQSLSVASTDILVITATPSSSYYAKIYTDSTTLKSSSKGTAVSYELSQSDIESGITVKVLYSTNPITGDDFDPMLWVIAMASAGAGAAITIAKKKSHN